jgi:penicillin-binding protein 1A
MRVYSADSELIADFGEEKRLPVAIDDVPDVLIKAILAAEDHSFFYHHGVDYFGVLRAAWSNLQSNGLNQGGSTITMQVARNYFLSPEKTYTRKLKEVLLAFELERDRSKKEILELYVNKVFLGQRAYGFAAAAQIYYGKDLKDLTLPEMAMLAGLPKAPSSDNPISNPRNALERRNYVLRSMCNLGFINKATLEAMLMSPETAMRHTTHYEVNAPYIAEMVRQYMIEKYDRKAYVDGFLIYTTIKAKLQRAANIALRQRLLEYDRRHGYRGAAGHLTLPVGPDRNELDEALQDYHVDGALVPGVVIRLGDTAAFVYDIDGEIVTLPWKGIAWARRYINENAVGPYPKHPDDVLRLGDIIYLEHVDASENQNINEKDNSKSEPFWRLAQVPSVAGALVALRPNDGAVLALTGGFNFHQSSFNRVTQAERQPGSSFKPFVYTAALDKGFTAATTFSGAPIVIEDAAIEDEWRPQDYRKKFFGPTRLRKALAMSLNLVSVRLLRATGVPYTVDYLARFGFESQSLPHDLSLTLGTASVTPMQMATAYAVFANGGYKIEPYFIARIEDARHKVLERANPTVVCYDCDRRKVEREPAFGGEKPGAREAFRVLSPELTFLMTSMMKDVIREGTGHAAMDLGRNDLAGKTGTSNDYRDAWFSGFNDGIVATAWMGFDQPATLGRGETGGRTALPLWMDFMRVALHDVPEVSVTPPEGIVKIAINPDTGLPARAGDRNAITEYFISGTETQTQGPSFQGDEKLARKLEPPSTRHAKYVSENIREKLF